MQSIQQDQFRDAISAPDDGKSIEDTWTEVTCQRSLAGAEYGRGLQDFLWSISAPSVWYPSKSYFRYELELYGPGGGTDAPKVSDQIAFAENAVSNSITNAYMYAGGQVVSSVVNSFPQCAAVAYRTGKTASWMKNQGGTFQQTGTLSERITAVSQTSEGGAPVGLSGLDDNREEMYRPVATNGGATLDVQAAPAPVLSGVAASAMADPGVSGVSDALSRADAVLTITAVTNAVNTAVDIVSGELQTRDDEAAARSLQRTIVSGAAAAGTATAFQNGTADAGVKIVIGGSTYTIVSVATDPGTGIQTLTVNGPAGPATGATTDWYAIRRTLRRSDQARHKIQVLWQPPLGIFQVGQPMGSGSYKISLSPDPNYRLTMCETKDPAFALLGADSRYNVVVRDVKFYACVGKMSIPDEIVQLDLMEYSAYSKVLQAKAQNLQFTVPASTETLYVALQEPSAGSNPAYPPNKFIGKENSDLNLISLQLSYGNTTKVMTRWTSGFTTGTNALEQLYYMSLQETQRDSASGGAESFNTWLDRGPIWAFTFHRDAMARDTELTVQIAYEDPEGGTFDVNSKLFIVSEYRRLVNLTHSRGQIVDVVVRDA